MKKRIISITMLIMILLLTAGCGKAGGYEKEIYGITEYLKSKYVDDWSVIVLAEGGADYDYAGYLKEREDYVTECYKRDERLDGVKATEWQRISLAVAAAGGNPRAFGKTPEGKSIDLIADGVYNWKGTDNLATQGSNALIYGLITLDSCDVKVPKDALYTREKIIDSLMEYRNDDGSFGLSKEGEGEVDITAMALQALAPYEDREDVKKAIDEAVSYLQESQESTGMYMTMGEYSSESSAQVIMALCALGIDPCSDESFEKAGGSLVDCLEYYKAEDGSYSHNVQGEDGVTLDNVMSSQQVGLALIATEKLKKGEKLFNYSQGK